MITVRTAGAALAQLNEPDAPHAPPPQLQPNVATPDASLSPLPAGGGDTSQQLSLQVARLVTEARQQILSTARESANEAVAAETRMLMADLHAQLTDAAKKSAAAAIAEQAEEIKQEAQRQRQSEREAVLSALREEMARELSQQIDDVRELGLEHPRIEAQVEWGKRRRPRGEGVVRGQRVIPRIDAPTGKHQCAGGKFHVLVPHLHEHFDPGRSIAQEEKSGGGARGGNFVHAIKFRDAIGGRQSGG